MGSLSKRLGQQSLSRAIRAVASALPIAAFAPYATAQVIDLGSLGTGGFRIDGRAALDGSGSAVSGAGDVNGDGLADLIIGAWRADPSGDSAAGETYVVFGKADAARVDLVDLAKGGFRIDGVDAYDNSGRSVSGAGDVNGDGLDDLIVGAHYAAPGGNSKAGESYVVFGKADATSVDLANLGNGGFRIDGIRENDESGWSVSGAGDVNGDGLADLIIGAWSAGTRRSGESYVVFGRAGGDPVNLANLGMGGFRIGGYNVYASSGRSVSGAGDVNGDGLADLIVGADFANPSNGTFTGESYVVFGKATPGAVNLLDLGSGGFPVRGIYYFGRLGYSVSGAGDVNGDGLADLIVGAYQAGDTASGESYVVFGKSDGDAVNLANLGTGGFRVTGRRANDHSGFRVSGAGDVNGDGLADITIGVFNNLVEFVGRSAGESYVVFGKAEASAVALADLGTGGFRMDGVDRYDFSGASVSGAGDVNGDGLADLIVGAPGGDGGAGESYVVFSPAVAQLNSAYRLRNREGDPPRVAVGISGDGSNDGTPDARFWIDFANGASPTGDASTETVTLTRSKGPFTDAAAIVSWRLQTTRLNWTAAEVRVRYLAKELVVADENDLELVFSPTGTAPFTPLTSVVNPVDNTISASINQAGYLFIGGGGSEQQVFHDGFEQP